MPPHRSYSSNFTDEDQNPCLEESKLTTKCLDVQLYSYEKCTAYFENYKMCKKFWGRISKQRQQAGISPHLPLKAERDKILKLKSEGIQVIAAND